MKSRKPTTAKLLTTLMLALAAVPALAQDGVFGLFGGAVTQVAQYNAEERRAMRERWEQAGPEERLKMRREFKERVRQLPPEYAREAMDPRRAPPPVERNRRDYSDDASFGFGFERRRYEDERYDNPAPAYLPNPGNYIERHKNRDKNRDGRRDDDRR